MDHVDAAGDAGSSLVGLLMAMLILGIIAAVAIGGGITTPKTAATATGATARAACASDYQTVNGAVQSYFGTNLVYPPPGTAWATSKAKGGPYLTSWPDDPRYYAISWNGSELDVVPAHGAPSFGSPGTSSPATGCGAA